jgi:hypothetical protein
MSIGPVGLNLSCSIIVSARGTQFSVRKHCVDVHRKVDKYALCPVGQANEHANVRRSYK